MTDLMLEGTISLENKLKKYIKINRDNSTRNYKKELIFDEPRKKIVNKLG